ncbi:MAG: molecular chaperone DnaJ [Phycisphaerae bacterium]|nr:molecular chaperone DnaJ [Phycisphaerae bacterium]HBZ96870.1 molecular chaperone DnaJ [Phycisphaerales bacterium]
MPSGKDYYAILGVQRTASADEIRKAYRSLARKYHPDVSTEGDAGDRFNEVQQAYEVLSDEEKRRAYDQFGDAGAGAAGWSGYGGGGGGDVDPDRFQDIFEQMFGGGGPSPGGNPFGGGGGAARPRRGGDVNSSMTVTFMTAAQGGVEEIRPDGASVEVRIPAGIDDGGKLRLRGRGQPGLHGGEAGDLIVTVHVGAHPVLRRDGLDLIVDVPISLAEAGLGTVVRVPLLKGSIELKIPPCTSSGRRLRVPGKGIVDDRQRTGDFYAQVQVVSPEELGDDARSLLEQLATALPDPRSELPGIDSVDAS